MRGREPALRSLSLFAVVAAAAVLLLACEEEGGTEGPVVDPPVVEASVERTGAEVVVTGDDERLPEGCRPGRVAGILAGFVDAFNAGDRASLGRAFFVAEGPSPSEFSGEGYYPWSWYSVSEVGEGGRVTGGFVTYEEALLMRYFARRHEAGERMGLVKVSLTQTGILGNRENVGFIAVLTRRADDLAPGLGGPDGVAYARGSVNCEGAWIFAWTMEMRSAETRDARAAAAWLCSDPPGWRPGEAVVACA